MNFLTFILMIVLLLISYLIRSFVEMRSRLHNYERIDAETSINSEMPSSSSTLLQKYEVFLSFRGEDTRNNIVSHLYAALHNRGILTFFDEEHLEKGQSITPELLKSIEGSKFAIIVFSKNYASSTWCLDELVKIMECRSKKTLTVIPLFYDINPSDIRKHENSFAESFAKHEVAFKDHMEKVQIWKDNLREAAKIAGHDFRNVPEAPLVKKIVDVIYSKLPLKPFAEGLFGIEDRLKELRVLLAEKPSAVCFLGIWGMGGVGKTTTAGAIFNELRSGFEGGCFLQDVCKKDIVDLQKAILLKFIRSPEYIDNEHEGRDMIRKCLCSKRVLLILDDVDSKKQLDFLAGNSDWFGEGSRIIITTRYKHLLNKKNPFYFIEPLSKDDAINLFRWHAFSSNNPPANLIELSDSFVRYTGGLPLALEILGSHLCGREVGLWESTLQKIKDDPCPEIMKTLKISFDGLNPVQQNIFLDIACLFGGYYIDDTGGIFRDKVSKKLDSFGFHPVVGITELIDKSLVHIDSDGKIQMHDLIREMGHDIVRQRANKKPESYSRLWNSKDINDALQKGKETGEIEAFILLTSDHKIELSEEAFTNMNRLRLLEIDSSNLEVATPNSLPNSLLWLHWYEYPGKSLPGEFQPSKLVSLNLSWSPKLVTFPNISCMPNLEYLNLCGCKELLVVPVAVHKSLKDLKLSFCEKLESFPEIEIESLETLSFRYSHALQSLPKFHKNMTHLKSLDLNFMRIKKFPCSIGNLTKLQEITMPDCHPPDEVVHCYDTQPSSVNKKEAKDEDGKDSTPVTPENSYADANYNPSRMLTLLLSLPSLEKIDMRMCKVSEITFPEIIGCSTSLQKLDLNDNQFVSLPKRINHFLSLQVLCLENSKIKELPELPSSIRELHLEGCTELTWVPHLLDLLNKYDKLCMLSLPHCETIANQSFLVLWDWQSLTNRLCKREEVLQIIFPRMITFTPLYGEEVSGATVTLTPPSSHKDKLRGFVIFATGKRLSFTVRANNSLVDMPYIYRPCDEERTAFCYIPMVKITSGRDWNEQENRCVLEVTTNKEDVKFPLKIGIHLVYDGNNTLMDTSDHIIYPKDIGV